MPGNTQEHIRRRWKQERLRRDLNAMAEVGIVAITADGRLRYVRPTAKPV